MNTFLVFLNLYAAYYTWRQASKYFEENANFSGWSFIFLSALNAAAAAALLTR